MTVTTVVLLIAIAMMVVERVRVSAAWDRWFVRCTATSQVAGKLRACPTSGIGGAILGYLVIT